jgi:hypothetical protein
VAKRLRAVRDDEVAGDTLLGGLEESDGMAFDLCRDLTKSDEPTDLGSLRFVEICPLPSSLTWLSDGGKRFRARFALDLESLGQPATPSRLVVPTREASEGDRPSHVGVFGRV